MPRSAGARKSILTQWSGEIYSPRFPDSAPGVGVLAQYRIVVP
jgi:hypothetical protein